MKPEHAARKIYLLGAPRVQDEHGARAPAAGKALSLLAYLVLNPRAAHPREFLAELLSPEGRPERVRRNFSDTLYRLQKSLGPGWLDVEGDRVALNAGPDLWVDVWAFERLAASEQAADLQAAVDLYAGDLLPEVYDDWIAAPRELLRGQYVAALDRLAAQQTAQGQLQQALLTTRRLLAAEPLHEPAHLAYLRLLGRLRRYADALAHYEYLRQRLQAELGAEPLPETRAVAQALQREREVAAGPEAAEERTPFVGRRAERAAALAALEAGLNGRGGLLAIEGEAGIGKSRLWREIAAGARWRGAAVAYGAASEVPGASPFAPLAEALAALLAGPRAAALAALLPPETLATLAPLYPAWQAAAPAGREAPAPDKAGQQFYAALRQCGEKLAALGPLVLALDDVQWADPALWACLQALAQSLPGAGGWLVLLYRRPEIERTPGWQHLQAWDRAGLLTTISLAPLTVDDVAQLVSDHPQLDPAQVHALSGGSPFLIGEWLAAPDQPLEGHAAGGRLQALSPAARQALECAAVLGESLPYRLWAEAAGLPPLALAGLSEELTARHWVQPSPEGYAFAHDLLRAAVYDAIEPERRRALHERAGRAYAALEPDNARARAFHLDQAGLAAEAAEAYRQAAQQDRARFAFREAQTALERALALMPKAPTRARAETALDLARTCEITGDRQQQAPALDEALAAAAALGDEDLRLAVLLVMGGAEARTGRLGEAGAHLAQALELAQQRQNAQSETEAIVLLGDLAGQQGKWSAAQARFSQALALAQAHADAPREARALRGLAIAARQMGAPHESVAWLERAAAVQRRTGDRPGEAVTQANLLGAYYELGALDKVIATAEAAWPVSEAAGDRFNMGVVRHVRGLAYYALGDYAAARRDFGLAEQDFEAAGNRRTAGLVRNSLGLVAEEEGRYDEAQALYRAALADAAAVQAATEMAYAQHDLGALLLRLDQPAEAIGLLEAAAAAWQAQGNTLLRCKSEAYLGLALLAAGDAARAEALADAGWAVFQAGVPAGEQPQGWLWALHRLLAELDRPEPARAVLRAAYDELQRQAQAISDPDRRRRFFENVSLNRAIVAAHDQLAPAGRVVAVQLARQSAPLGRPLRPDERVTVQWTVNAPEDEAVPDKAQRRRLRLQRLLREAAEQGGAPTDSDLAAALGVSRRTILRDIQALAGTPTLPPTRKRKT